MKNVETFQRHELEAKWRNHVNEGLSDIAIRSKDRMKKEKTLRPLRLCGEKLPGLPRVSRGFTLIELLVVISIIAILAGMVMPTFYYAKKRARESKARAAVKALETAFKAYLDTYKVWPDGIVEGTAYEIKDDGNPVKFFSILRGNDADWNQQGIAFFEFESTTNYPSQTTAYDPWSDPSVPSSLKAYQVMFDKDYDNKIRVPASVGGDDVYRCVVVWSEGDRSESGNYVASWK